MIKKVFVLQHVANEDEYNENVKFIGVYSSKTEAERAINSLKNLSGFKKYPLGFYIDEYTLDKTNWVSGFGTDDD